MKNKLTFFGDVYLDKPFSIDDPPENFVFNLEYPISERGTPLINKVNLRQKRSYLRETFGRMPLGVTLANNHVFDYGDEAFEDTVAYLDKNGIKYCGAGNQQNNFNNPLSIDAPGKKIKLFAYCGEETGIPGIKNKNYGPALIDQEKIKADLEKHRGSADIRICALHWGEEEVQWPAPAEINLAHAIIDAGADMIIGHHPHVMRPLEIYRGKPIFYSIGNFIFPDLNMKTYWDGERFTRSLKKKQNKENRSGLRVDVDLESREFKVFKTLQKRNSIITCPVHLPDQGTWLNNPEYAAFYQKFYKKRRRQILLNAFLNNPRIPQMGSVKELFRSLKS